MNISRIFFLLLFCIANLIALPVIMLFKSYLHFNLISIVRIPINWQLIVVVAFLKFRPVQIEKGPHVYVAQRNEKDKKVSI